MKFTSISWIAVLPGHKFTILVGQIVGLIFPTDPRKVLPYAILATLWTFCMLLYSVDFMLTVLPQNVEPTFIQESGTVQMVLFHGFTTFYGMIGVATRAYFLVRYKGVRKLLESIEQADPCGACLQKRSFWAELRNSLPLVTSFALITLESAYLVRILSFMDKSNSWFLLTNDSAHVTLTFFFIIWPGSLARFVCFAIILTTLKKLLCIFDSFCSRVQKFALSNEVGMMRISKLSTTATVHQTSRILQYECVEDLMSSMENIQELFKIYDQVIGPIILTVVTHSTLGLIDTISGLLNPKEELELVRARKNVGITALTHMVALSILNAGFRCQNQIGEIKTSLRRNVGMTWLLQEDKGLRTVLKRIYKWNWKMSAAGFFTVNRSLVAGMISTMMTYIVLLLQIQDSKVPTCRMDQCQGTKP